MLILDKCVDSNFMILPYSLLLIHFVVCVPLNKQQTMIDMSILPQYPC